MGGRGSRKGRWDGWDWVVAGWVMVLDWVFELAQWVISNVVPVFKNGTVQGAVLAGLVFGVSTLVLRVLRNNERERRNSVFPLTPPLGWTGETEVSSGESRIDQERRTR